MEKVCKCKVGSCQICGSKCRCCLCACDRIEPLEALARSRGGYRRQVNAIKKKQTPDGTTMDTDTDRTRNKRKKIQSHFKMVGWMREAPIAPRAVKPKTNKKKQEDSGL